jgi:pantoate--beta-alanine ligase
MKIFKTIDSLQEELQTLKLEGKQLAFVPTMGALHEGHLSLILEAQQENDCVLASIYVNPTQFNDPKDLEKYPRPIEKDIRALEQLGCDYLFLPETEEIYPKGLVGPSLDLKGLDNYMEGAHRPGHFAGVVQVVHRLLDIVHPDSLYMGQKDFQQYSIIAHMLKELNIPVRLVRVAIVREADGLAMSSRNVHLSEEGRRLAPILHKTLEDLKYHYEQNPKADPRDLEQQAIKAILDSGVPSVDYLDIVNGYSLQPIQKFDETDFVVSCATIRLDGIRLLDNIILKEEQNPAYLQEQAEKQMLKDRVDALKN